MRKRYPQNPRLIKLDRLLRKAANENNAPIWDRVRELLLKPRRKRIAVNISRINRYTKDGDIVVVPGKVLSCGKLNHSVTIAAFDFSAKALEKIKQSNSKAILIEDLLKKRPDGSEVKIIV